MLLSKSKFMYGLQCKKLLWCSINKKDIFPPIDPFTQRIFDNGQAVGELAQQLFPNGIIIGRTKGSEQACKETLEALKQNKPIYEAGFIYKNSLAFADIINPVENGKWDIIEVKSTGEVQDCQLEDLAYQRYLYEGAGLNINKCYLAHINKDYLRKGDIDVHQLFTIEDVTEKISKITIDFEKETNDLLALIDNDNEPIVEIGTHCKKPHNCPLFDICREFLPEENVSILNGLRGDIYYPWIKSGILHINDLSPDMVDTDKHLIQLRSHKDKEIHVDKEEIHNFLKQLEYPLYFLDFETIAGPIPIFEDLIPHEKIAFQFSLHTIVKERAKPVHYSFLAKTSNDPRRNMIKALKDNLGDTGTILAYYMPFEKSVIKETAAHFPEYKDWSNGIISRMKDLIDPFKKFYYYNPKQLGSASIKKVLPALTELSYENLNIPEGGTASNEYYRVTFGDNISQSDKDKVYADLEEYCCQDTWAMVRIWEELGKIVS